MHARTRTPQNTTRKELTRLTHSTRQSYQRWDPPATALTATCFQPNVSFLDQTANMIAPLVDPKFKFNIFIYNYIKSNGND